MAEPPNKNCIKLEESKSYTVAIESDNDGDELKETMASMRYTGDDNEISCDELEEESSRCVGAQQVWKDGNTGKKHIASCDITSALLQQEKQHISFPTVRKKRKSTEENLHASLPGVMVGSEASFCGGPTLRGLGKNKGRIVSHPPQEKSNGDDNTKGLKENPSYISYLDERPAPSSNNNNDLPTNLDHVVMPAPPNNDVLPTERAGANVQRLDQLRFSLVGDRDQQEEPIQNQARITSSYDHLDCDILVNLPNPALGNGEEAFQARVPVVLPTEASPDLSNNHLAVAKAIEDDKAATLSEAQEVDPEVLQRKETDKQKRRECRMFGCVIIVICSIVVGLSLGLSNRKPPAANSQLMIAASFAPSRPPPPMENLELLYHDLPDPTKESLYNSDSPQYQAWDWLLNHPNITSFPEWRKKQIFAIVTFFYSIEGQNWPAETPARSRWMDATTDECSWVLSDDEASHWAQQSNDVLGPGAYEPHDFQSCNQEGKLQALFVSRLLFPTAHKKLSFPPQIGMLTSLKILGIGWSTINAELSNLVIPEVIGLPRLEMLVFQQSGVSGTIPHEVSQLTDLRHLLIGANNLIGTVPTELSMMTSLEHLTVANMDAITGTLPSDLGLMTSLTGLEIDRNSFTGRIPSELGLLNKMSRLGLFENRLTGSLPTELALMTDTTGLRIWNNGFTGSVPSELGLMTNLVDLRLGNNLMLQASLNNFSGSLPKEFWGLSHLESLHLPNLPNLHGKVPAEIMMLNLTMLSLSGSPKISGTIPSQVCLFVEELDFDCSDLLCGCDCHCAASGHGTHPDV